MMRDSDPHPESDAAHEFEYEAERDTRGPLRWLFYVLGFVLLGACVWLAVAGARTAEGPSGWERLSEADPAHVAWMLALVAAALVLNGWVFWVMVKPFEGDRPVGLGDMIALIGATSILNYLPMRAGLVGRAAYLKRHHEIGYRTSAVMMLVVAGGTVYVFAALVGATLWRLRFDPLWWAAVLGAMVIGAAVAPVLLRWKLRWTPGLKDVPAGWFERARLTATLGALALLLARMLDVFLLAGRLYLAARIFGTPLEWPAALVMASGGMFITLATPLPNGLGLRESIYGLFAAVGVGGEALPSGSMGVAIGLIDRAVEAAAFITFGLGSMAYLHKKEL